MHLVLAVLFLLVPVMGDYTPTSDGAPNDENIAATFAANKVVGDVYPQGADEPFQRLLNTRGGGFMTMNSDPSVVGTDPLTGLTAPVGTDVGFAAPIRRAIQTGVLNGDFAQGPLDQSAPISDDNSLPYWTWTPEAGGSTSLQYVADANYASGYRLQFNASAAAGALSYLTQLVAIPMSKGQQWRVLLSAYMDKTYLALGYQYVKFDGTTLIGSEEVLFGAGTSEAKVDAGLVPETAGYIRLRIRYGPSASDSSALGEVRAAFVAAEATLGLGSMATGSGGITTTETQVKGITIPANSLVVGSVYRIEAWANVTSSAANVVTFRVRLGPTTLTGAVVDSINPTATTTAAGESIRIEALVTVRSVGATGTVIGGVLMVGGASQPFSVATRVDQNSATTTIDTTVANVLELTARTAAGTTTVTFRQGIISCLMAS